MEIITNAENRKELVKALSGHFGQRSEYLGPPSFAYRIGSIRILLYFLMRLKRHILTYLTFCFRFLRTVM